MINKIFLLIQVGLTEFLTDEYHNWIVKQCGQIVILVSQINFNKQIVKCMHQQQDADKTNIIDALDSFRDSLIECINIASNTMSKDLPNYKLMTIEALLTIQVHSRDILSGLIENKVSQRQLVEICEQTKIKIFKTNN